MNWLANLMKKIERYIMKILLLKLKLQNSQKKLKNNKAQSIAELKHRPKL